MVLPQKLSGVTYNPATLKVPGESLYWEDSRIYLNKITEVNLINTSTPDPFPPVPLRIVVHGDKLDVEIPRTYLKGTAATMNFGTKDQVVSHLKNTDIWGFYLLAPLSSIGFVSKLVLT